MELITIEEGQKWNNTIRQFHNWDIYYLNEYAKSLQLHGDGTPYLVFHEKEGNKIAYVVMQQDIGESTCFQGKIAKNCYFDWTTPYGYGGSLTEGNITENWMKDFTMLLAQWCRHHGIVTQFFRFHPLLANQNIMGAYSDVISLKKTVFIDTREYNTIWENMTTNNRNMVRKAERNGVQIFYDQGQHLDAFQQIYESTMKDCNASDYYYFKREYFTYLINSMPEHTIFFYAVYEGNIISASMFFYNERYMHYHLSGTLSKYRRLAPVNLLLTKAAEWAAENKIEKMHLGGGVEIEDSLLAFKKHFNRKGLADFAIGRTIFHQEWYEELVHIRQKTDSDFDIDKNYLILYRG